MEWIEGLAIGANARKVTHPSKELLFTPPSDPRAWHCKTVEEYRIFRFSSNYQGYEGGSCDLLDNIAIDYTEQIECVAETEEAS